MLVEKKKEMVEIIGEKGKLTLDSDIDSFFDKFIELVSDKRKEMGLTQKEMAPLLGMSVSSYVHFESRRKSPTLHKMIKVSNYLGLSMRVGKVWVTR